VRLRFFVAYAFTWILLGNVLALLLMSAGPAYYGFVVDGTNPFGPLLENVRAGAPGMAAAQLQLWQDVIVNQGAERASLGISAAPSIHVAVPALFAMVAWPLNRRVAWLMWGYTVLILLSTVQLAWHYALDGYLGIIGAFVVLKATDLALRRWTDGRPRSPRAAPSA
jgi:membrane-associated phospholipid phosphatase